MLILNNTNNTNSAQELWKLWEWTIIDNDNKIWIVYQYLYQLKKYIFKNNFELWQSQLNSLIS